MSSSSSSTSSYPFPDLPVSGITFPHSPITTAAFAYTKEHTTEAVYNHCARGACFALILAKKLAPLAAADAETVVLGCVLHDMGWSFDKELLSPYKRFEVDGADIARRFIQGYRGEDREKWDEARVQKVWDIIALHATPSIATFSSAEVAAASLGIYVDFAGPLFPADPFGDPAAASPNPTPGAVITVAEFREVHAAFPYAGFDEDAAKNIFCGLCRDKPASTYDNFVSAFGREFGLDGKGAGKEEYTKAWEKGAGTSVLLGGFPYLRGLLEEKED
ncbi:metal dependent phosphohydrolase [Xylaria sp. FL1777]|nr:metal dependent phosphohydrolase [Xylaria sp. FL1777]